MRKLDLGCGIKKQLGAMGLDNWEGSDADVICNLEHGIPILSDSVDEVHASHFLEHMKDLTGLMREVHRVCISGARVSIISPYCGNPSSLENPDHKTLIGWSTLDFYTLEEKGFPRLFRVVSKSWGMIGKNPVLQALIRMTGGVRGPLRGFIEELQFELEVIK